MPSTRCYCQAELSGDDRDAQVAAAVEHFAAAHPDFPLTEVQIRNYLEREEEQTGSTDRLDEIGDVEIVPIGPERLGDVLAFFDHDAFADNVGWASCYCMAHHVPDAEWSQRSWQQNRSDIAERITSGTTTGVLAYVDGRLAAWCNASRRDAFPDAAGGSTDDERTGFVACFAVAPPYRGHGLAKRLLTAALDELRRLGLEVVEAHPAVELRGPGSAYRGTVPLYEQAGFTTTAVGPPLTMARPLRDPS